MNNINYEKLSEKLFMILEYENYRPEDICAELMREYGKYYYEGTVYHGAFGNTQEDVVNSYYGFISCTYDKEIAECFARSYYHEDEEERNLCTIFKVNLNGVFGLDVQQLIEKCYINCPDNELCKYLYDAYNSENELLLCYEDIEDDIEFIS